MKTTALCFSILAVLILNWVGLPVMAQDTGVTGGGQSFDKRQPTLAVNYIICTSGTYPTKPTGSPALGAVDPDHPLLGEIYAVSFASPIPPGFAPCQGQLLPVSQYVTLFSLLLTTYGGNGTTTFALPNLGGRTPIGAVSPAYPEATELGADYVTLAVSNLPAHVHSTPDGITGFTGGGMSFSNVQPSMAINFNICTNGQIMMFAGNFSPQGWVPCDGSLYSISAQPTLFGFIGTNYGGNGITTFAVPDLRGRAPIGYAGNSITPLNFSSYAPGQASGSTTQALTVAQIPSHSHSLPGGGTTSLTGESLPFDTRQPTLGLGWYICESGGSPTNAQFPMTGELRLFAGNSSPVPGFAQAAGETEDQEIETALFNLIGTTYGSSGFPFFDVPDLRSRLAVGAGYSPSGIDYNVGTTAGAEYATLTINQMPAHVHALPGIIQVQTASGTILTNGATLSCPNAPDGGYSLDSLVITNIGGLNLALSNATFSGGNPGDFSLTPSIANTSLPVSNSLSANVQFAPSLAGTRTAELSIANADVTNNPFVLYLTGVGAPVLTDASLTNGSFVFSFAANPTNQYTVLTATNLSLPLSNWTVMGLATNTSVSNFTFGAAMTAGQSQQFYMVLAQ